MLGHALQGVGMRGEYIVGKRGPAKERHVRQQIVQFRRFRIRKVNR